MATEFPLVHLDGVYKVTTNDGTDVTLDQDAQTPEASQFGGSTIKLMGAGASWPSASGPERFRIQVFRVN